ncbi:MAG: MFS transporter [Chloroflexota bacterium]|nr:MFS transporter [Chloroflexota bacterium]
MAQHPSPTIGDGAPLNDGLWSPKRRALSLGMVFTITLLAFEALAIGTVMPAVSRELNGLELYGWAFSAFFLGDLVGIVVVGGLIDRAGLARPFVIGLVLFALGLVIGGLAPSMEVLIAGRLLQGLGAGAIPPTAYVAIGRSLPERLRPQMFATLSTAWVLPGVIGPALAGVITQTLGWRIVFVGLLPLVLLAGAMTLRSLIAVPAPRVAPGDE